MPVQGRKLSIRSKLKNKFSQRKIIARKVTTAIKSTGAYKMTSGRKAALMKAVKASALARSAKAARNNANSGRKGMSLKNQAKTQVSKTSNTVAKAAGRGRAAVSSAASRAQGATRGAVVQARARFTKKGKAQVTAGQSSRGPSAKSVIANQTKNTAGQSRRGPSSADARAAQANKRAVTARTARNTAAAAKQAGASRSAAPTGNALGRGQAARQAAARRNRAYEKARRNKR